MRMLAESDGHALFLVVDAEPVVECGKTSARPEKICGPPELTSDDQDSVGVVG